MTRKSTVFQLIQRLFLLLLLCTLPLHGAAAEIMPGQMPSGAAAPAENAPTQPETNTPSETQPETGTPSETQPGTDAPSGTQPESPSQPETEPPQSETPETTPGIARITSCRLSSKTRVKVTAVLDRPELVPGSRCYLFALPFSNSTILPGSRPVQSRAKSGTMTFSIPLNQKKSSSRLYARFVVAMKNTDGSYTAISGSRCVSNPGKAARYRYKFPTAASKKGLQVCAGMLEDAAELNVRHSTLNIVFTEMISTAAESNKTASIAYKYHGRTYWFRKSVIHSYDRQLKSLKQSGTIISGILLLGWRDDLVHLIYPDGREKGHAFYAWNTAEKDAREQLQAAISFLANRYSSSKRARIVNWIVGNEVNNYKVYNYAGKKTISQYAAIYADAFRLTYNTAASVYKNARVYISLDHLWNTTTVPGTYASRKMLDSFVQKLDRHGHIPWNLAYHPYSSPLTEPKFWENKNHQLTDSLTSPVINMGNIGLLTSYIRNTYGANTRIILSEQGFTSVQKKKKVEKEQSAAIVYSYYLTEADDMIDSFIMNRHVDHEVEVAQGLNLGLWTTDGKANPEWAARKKDSWNVFKYMDTNQSPAVAAPALAEIGASDWSQLVAGYSPALYTKTNLVTADLKRVKKYGKRSSIPSKWQKYGAAAALSRTKKGLRVYHDNTRNPNSLWGFTQSFKKLRFTSASRFYTTLKISGAASGKALVKLRFLSGSNILECSRVIPAGKSVKLGVSLAGWAGRGSVTKIQVLAAPVGGGWTNGASLSMRNTVRGK